MEYLISQCMVVNKQTNSCEHISDVSVTSFSCPYLQRIITVIYYYFFVKTVVIILSSCQIPYLYLLMCAKLPQDHIINKAMLAF